MSAITLGTIERKFAELIWAKEPVTTSELVKLAEKEFSWKRTTTHTVIKRLCDKGLFENNRGTVKALISEKEFLSLESRAFVQESFSGSLPAFIAAFASGSVLSEDDIKAISKMIEEAEEK